MVIVSLVSPRLSRTRHAFCKLIFAASAAVCTSIERRSMLQPCTGRALDRHSPHLRDPRREKTIINSMSQAPSKSKSYSQKTRKNSGKQVELISPAGSSRYLLDDAPFFDVFPDLEEEEEEEGPIPPLLPVEPARLQASKGDESRLPSSKRDDSAVLKPDGSTFVRPSSFKGDDSAVLKPSSSKGDDFIVFSPSSLEGDDSAASGSSSFSGDKSAVLWPSPTRPQDQVVVLRVSLHCKGCEGKVRKHISKMAGVTSFNIDFATKKVTVIGDVTPLGVLNSISKVKNAQFWPSQPGGSSAPT